MKKGILCLGLIIPITLIILQGCGEPAIQEETTEKKDTATTGGADNASEDVALVQELTLELEDSLIGDSSGKYVFNGFLGEDTLSFQHKGLGNDGILLYIPAKVGHKFKLKNFAKVKEVEILEFNSDKGYLKLKISIK